MSEERLVFANSIEALFLRGVGSQLTADIKADLRGAGIDVDKPLLPAYPSKTYQRGIEILASRLHPGLASDQAQYKLGERAVFGLTETFLGRSAIVLSKLIGTRRSLLRFPISSMASTNFAKMEAKELSPTSVEISTCPLDGHIEFLRGCVCAAVILTGGREPKCEVLVHDPKSERAVVRISWAA